MLSYQNLNGYYTNEIVFPGHPDKICDQISDAILDSILEEDHNAHAGIEVLGGKNLIVVTGEVKSAQSKQILVKDIVNSVLTDYEYNIKDYEIINNIGVQSDNIDIGVKKGGAGDQGMMFGFACNETTEKLPIAMVILQKLALFYETLRKNFTYLRSDGKAQITGLYKNGKLTEITDFVISYQNDENPRQRRVIDDVLKSFCESISPVSIRKFHINPTGEFYIGGFNADAGLTGRKIVVDNYQGFYNVGGGAFSGKDPSKVDRSAAYMARCLAKNIVEQTGVDWCGIQVSYAIGEELPLNITIQTNKGEYPYVLPEYLFTPNNITNFLNLRSSNKNFSYRQTAKYGHFGNNIFPWENKKIDLS